MLIAHVYYLALAQLSEQTVIFGTHAFNTAKVGYFTLSQAEVLFI